MSRRAACARWLVPAVLTVGATACGAAGLQATPTPTETVTVLPNAPDESAAAMSRSDAAQVFLDAVCPSDYAFGALPEYEEVWISGAILREALRPHMAEGPGREDDSTGLGSIDPGLDYIVSWGDV